VKINGMRVELGEIEHRLRAYPDINDAVVTAQQTGAGKRLVAFVASPGAATDTFDVGFDLGRVLHAGLSPAPESVLDDVSQRYVTPVRRARRGAGRIAARPAGPRRPAGAKR
jgi:hypothetical protein